MLSCVVQPHQNVMIHAKDRQPQRNWSDKPRRGGASRFRLGCLGNPLGVERPARSCLRELGHFSTCWKRRRAVNNSSQFERFGYRKVNGFEGRPARLFLLGLVQTNWLLLIGCSATSRSKKEWSQRSTRTTSSSRVGPVWVHRRCQSPCVRNPHMRFPFPSPDIPPVVQTAPMHL